MAGLAQEIATSPHLHGRVPSSTSTNPCQNGDFKPHDIMASSAL